MTNSKKIRFASWSAVSSAKQAEKESLSDQLRLNQEFVVNLERYYPGYQGEITKEYRVIGSRSIVDLQDAIRIFPAQYGSLIEGVKRGEFDAVICRSRDRLGRTDSLIYSMETLCLSYGVAVVARQSLPLTLDASAIRANEDAGLIGVIEGFFATSSVRRLVNEHKAHMIARVQKRKLFASNPPWGYQYRFTEDGVPHIVIDVLAAPVIRTLLLEMYVRQRLSLPEIAGALNERKLQPQRGETWTVDSVRHIIDLSERYAGYISLNRRSKTGRTYVSVRGDHEPILSDWEWAQVQAERNARATIKMKKIRHLSGIVICAEAQAPMSVQTQRYRVGDDFAYVHTMRCVHCRPQHTIRESVLLDAVRLAIQQLQEVVDVSVLIDAMRERGAERLEQEVVELRERLVDLELKKQLLLSVSLEREELSADSITRRMRGIEHQEAAIEAAIATAQTKMLMHATSSTAADRLENLRNIGTTLLDGDPKLVQQWLHQCVRVYVRGNQIERIVFI